MTFCYILLNNQPAYWDSAYLGTAFPSWIYPDQIALGAHRSLPRYFLGRKLNPLKPELNPICYLLALLGAHHFLHVSRIRVKLLTLR